MARLCKEAGFVGRYTNHSLRATAATRLFVAGVDEQLIAEKTGHRSTAIRGYKRTSEAQQREVSDIVQKKVKAGNSIATATTDSATAGTSEINIQAKGISLNLKF